MRNFIAYILLALIVAVSITGIAGITCWGCMPKHQSVWWMLGASSLFGTCCIIATTYSTFRFTIKQRWLLNLVACALVSVLIITGIWFNSWLPRTGPPRRGDLFQLASLIPLLTISLSFTPMLLRIYRGIQFSRIEEPLRPSLRPTTEYLYWAMLFGAAFALPVAANLTIKHSAAETGFFVLFAIACIFVGSLILYPAILILMRCNWMCFSLTSISGLSLVWLAIACFLAMNGFGLTASDIALSTTAILSGPIMLLIFFVAIRTLGFRVSIPIRRFNATSTPNDLRVHPLDA